MDSVRFSSSPALAAVGYIPRFTTLPGATEWVHWLESYSTQTAISTARRRREERTALVSPWISRRSLILRLRSGPVCLVWVSAFFRVSHAMVYGRRQF